MLVGLSFNIVLTALGTAGLPFAREAFLVMGFGFGALLFGIGLLSDIRSMVAPKGGIGLFFGTFNPFHNTHLAMIRRALDERGLDKVIIHPTLIPRMHADAFRKGELRVGRLENGFQIYETTDKADVNVDYFPTGKHVPAAGDAEGADRARGRRGRPAATRSKSRSIREIYDKKGFQGVIAEIKRRIPACGCIACTAPTTAACTCARSATNAAGSIRGASCAATAFRRRRSAAAPRA